MRSVWYKSVMSTRCYISGLMTLKCLQTAIQFISSVFDMLSARLACEYRLDRHTFRTICLSRSWRSTWLGRAAHHGTWSCEHCVSESKNARLVTWDISTVACHQFTIHFRLNKVEILNLLRILSLNSVLWPLLDIIFTICYSQLSFLIYCGPKTVDLPARQARIDKHICSNSIYHPW